MGLRSWLLISVALVAFSFLGCDADGGTSTAQGDVVDSHTTPDDELELVGAWEDNWGGAHAITPITWTVTGPDYETTYGVRSYDNEHNWVVTQFDKEDEYAPNLFSKMAWTEIDGDVTYICATAESFNSQAAAEAADHVPDASDPMAAGCGGFTWTELVRATP